MRIRTFSQAALLGAFFVFSAPGMAQDDFSWDYGPDYEHFGPLGGDAQSKEQSESMDEKPADEKPANETQG